MSMFRMRTNKGGLIEGLIADLAYCSVRFPYPANTIYLSHSHFFGNFLCPARP